MIILGGLEKFVSSDCQKKYLGAVKSKVIEEQVMEKGKNDPVDRYKAFINQKNEMLSWKSRQNVADDNS